MKKKSEKRIDKNYLLKQACATFAIAILTATLFMPSVSASILETNSIQPAAVSTGNSQTYTTDADFAMGTLFNVNNTAPNGNQLQLNTQLTTFPVMWIANTNESTVSKIDTNTGKELARYRTYFNSGGYPSRTAVDRDGNVYVLNRTFCLLYTSPSPRDS